MNNIQQNQQPMQNFGQPVKPQKINKDNDSKKIFTMLILVFTLMICTTGATYAYFALSATNNVMTGTAATASLTLTVTQATLQSGNTSAMVPQLESTLGTAMNPINQCVDANGNIVCKAYTITITNKSTAAVKVKGTISFTGTSTSMINLKWKRTTSVTAVSTSTTGSYSSTNTNVCTLNGDQTACSTFPEYDLTAGTACTTSAGVDTGCTSVSLAKSSGSATYYVVVWINETNAIQTDSGTWKATVKFEGENGTGVTSTIKG